MFSIRVREKLWTARRLFFKPPGLIHRLRLYFAFRIFAARWKATESFDLKIPEVTASPDNARIPRVPGAGTIKEGFLIMHNGIRIVPDSYVGEGMTRLLQANRGVHEPQEEVAFARVLQWLPRGASMLELGSYWAFYSLWFSREIPGARCHCVEPVAENLRFGEANFRANGRSAQFLQGFIGAQDRAGDGEHPATYCVDSLMERFRLDRLGLLHADIQGHEMEMLRGARRSLAEGKVDFVFISSHSNLLHYQCLEFLESLHYRVLAEADLLETFSHDGVIVAARSALPHLEPIVIAKKVPGLLPSRQAGAEAE